MLQYLDSLRFNYENKLFVQLQMDPALTRSLSAAPKLHEFHARKRQVLGSAVKITPSLIPELYGLYQTCLGFFGGKIQGDLYVQQQHDYNAYVYSAGSRFDIILSSAIVKDFNQREIAFVIGHELGHVLFEHNKIPVGHVLQSCEGISYELAHRLFQWSRAAEISADRIGMLCGGSLSSAANAFFKLSSGLALQNEEEIIRSLRSQFDEIKKLSGASDDWVCTHPLIPIRFKSLELIALDILALRNRGTLSKVSWAQIDSQISEVLIETEPAKVSSYLSSKEGVSLLVLCLLYVAICDGMPNSQEEQFIYDVRQRAALNINIEDVISVCRRDIQDFARVALSEVRGIRVEKDDAVRIVQLCHYLAISDTPLNDAEFRALNEVCEALGCEPWVVDSVIGQHEAQ